MFAEGNKPSHNILPFISDAGGHDPERTVFTCGLVLTAAFAFITMEHVYRLLAVRIDQLALDDKLARGVSLSSWNRVAWLASVLSVIGLCLLATVPYTINLIVHLIGAEMCFSMNSVWQILVTHIFSRIRQADPSSVNTSFFWLKYVCAVVGVLSQFAMLVVGAATGSHMHMQEMTDAAHIGLPLGEYFLVASMTLFFLGLYPDLKGISVNMSYNSQSSASLLSHDDDDGGKRV
eukprot:TRINITY_DN2991_c0_g1_i2.p1 TRINITY_DN2991_c0_g1~~TRINITY_DN2991_c0_g1_i2.p1  ORF type:complete len:234 (+),score=56.65 TRINITY_DN2991_c0_g1_i2:46-747(+)